MSYTRAPSSTLIAREGYSDYVAVGAAPGETAPTTPAPTTHWYDTLLSVGKGALSVYGESQKGSAYKEIALAQAASGKGAAPASSGMPSWVLPVAIGGVGLVAVLMLTRK